ncbi:hypothetical protein ACFX1X_026497 [Malus domestica]
MHPYNRLPSSGHKQQQQLPLPPCTAAPPQHLLSTSDAATADALLRLLHRLPHTLSSLPTRRSPLKTCPQLISFSDVQAKPTLISYVSQLGFFQLTNHHIPF